MIPFKESSRGNYRLSLSSFQGPRRSTSFLNEAPMKQKNTFTATGWPHNTQTELSAALNWGPGHPDSTHHMSQTHLFSCGVRNVNEEYNFLSFPWYFLNRLKNYFTPVCLYYGFSDNTSLTLVIHNRQNVGGSAV